jgi:hypothetical protein
MVTFDSPTLRRTTMPDHDDRLAGDGPTVRGGQPPLPIPDLPDRGEPTDFAGDQPTVRGGQPPLPLPDLPDRGEPTDFAGDQPTVRGGLPPRTPDDDAG